jgi:hypothetical protein
MIKNILEMLKIDNFYNESETIEIAKGKFKLEKNYKNIYKQKVRKLSWPKKE